MRLACGGSSPVHLQLPLLKDLLQLVFPEYLLRETSNREDIKMQLPH